MTMRWTPLSCVIWCNPRPARCSSQVPVISTGNGTIKAASGYASLDVDIDLDMDVIFEGVDLTESRRADSDHRY